MFSTNLLTPQYLDLTNFERFTNRTEIEERFQNYLSDESKLKGEIPLSISFPKSVEELASVLSENFNANETTTFSGARSGIVGGAVPYGKTHLVSMEKLRGVVGVFKDEEGGSYLKAKSGTPLSEINTYLDAHHPELFYPVDPTYQHGAIGGNTSTNAGGARSFYYGPTRKWIRGLTVVLSDGGVLSLVRKKNQAKNGELEIQTNAENRKIKGTSVRVPKTKHAIGYHFNDSVDVVDMFVGAEGTLGGIAEVEIRLTTRPKNRLYFTQFFESVDNAFQFATEVKKIGLSILALEFVDHNSIKLVTHCAARAKCRTIQAIKPEYCAAVFLDITYEKETEFELIHLKLEQLLSSIGVSIESSIAGTDSRDLEDFKVFRHAVPENINMIVAQRKMALPSLYKISTDMSVDPDRLRDLFDFYNSTLSRMGLDYFVFGHFGDAHLHLNVVPETLEQLKQFQGAYPSFAKKVVECGGAVAGEHGIGRVKKDFLAIQYSAEELETLRKIKSFFDPKWLLNPGVLLD